MRRVRDFLVVVALCFVAAFLLGAAAVIALFFVQPSIAAELVAIFKDWLVAFGSFLIVNFKAVSTIGGIPAAIFIWNWWKGRQSVLAWGKQCYLSETRLAEGAQIGGSSQLQEKQRYYGLGRWRGAASGSLAPVARGFAANWEAHKKLLSLIGDEAGRKPCHVCVWSSRRHGRSTTLAAAALQLTGERKNHVLWLASPEAYRELLAADSHPFDWAKLLRYARLARGWWHLIKVPFQRQRLIVVIDGVKLQNDGEQAGKLKAEFLDEFALMAPRRFWERQLFLITSNLSSPLQADQTLEVYATPADLAATLTKLKEAPQLLQTTLESPQDVYLKHGGQPNSRNIQDFLRVLRKEGLDVGQEGLSDRQIAVLKYIAASQLLKGGERIALPMPSGLLVRVVRTKRLNPDIVHELTALGLITDADHVTTDKLKGYAFEVTQLAADFFEDYDLVRELPDIYGDVAAQVFSNGPPAAEEVEYLRYLLQRLGRERDIALPGFAPGKIAHRIASALNSEIRGYLNTISDGVVLCNWAGTLCARELHQEALVESLCARIVDQFPNVPNQDGRAFVTYTRALRSLKNNSLKGRATTALNVEQLLLGSAAKEGARRLNQVLHSYCGLTRNLSDFNRLGKAIEGLGVDLDTASLILKARLEWRSEPWVAGKTFDEAVARPENATNTAALVQAILDRFRYRWQQNRDKRWHSRRVRSERRDTRRAILTEFRGFLKEIQKWHLGWSAARRASIIGTYFRWAFEDGDLATSDEIGEICESVSEMARGEGGRPADADFLAAVVAELGRVGGVRVELARQQILKALEAASQKHGATPRGGAAAVPAPRAAE